MEFRRVLFRSEDLIEELEGVALLDLAQEIDVVAEGADLLVQHGVRHLAVGRGDREVAVDGAFRVGELEGHRRSEESRVGPECGSTCRSRGSPDTYKKNITDTYRC